MKAIVCGGRDYDDVECIVKTLCEIHDLTPITSLIHGGAPGADSLAGLWAKNREIKTTVFYADWKAHGRAAGPIRNRQMAETKPDLVVAFPGGKGTQNMIETAKDYGIKVLEVPSNGI
jgi:hypothetical protein